jgi:hypothetical protein
LATAFASLADSFQNSFAIKALVVCVFRRSVFEMVYRKIRTLLICLSLGGTTIAMPACAKLPADNQNPPNGSQSQPAVSPVSANSQNSSPSLQAGSAQSPTKSSASPAPTLSEVNDAVARVFAKVANPGTAPNTNFVIGDFNGDGSEDLAVVVKPNDDKIAEVNDEMANWILEDPRKVPLPRSNLSLPLPAKPSPVRAEKGELLLAIIHGVGAQGWRSVDAKQTFLLKNGTASNLTTQPSRSLRERKDKQSLPPIKGDAINEAVDGKSVMILWTGAKYAWYTPETK